MINIPAATYRIQFNPSFGFQEAKGCVSYLADLGISHIYASPIFKAKKGSLHGYDVVDSAEINPELGGAEKFDELSLMLGESGIGWIQDIVPNHMAYDYENAAMMDVLEKGKKSSFYGFFDVDWEHPFDGQKEKILAPFLGRSFAQCLEDKEIQLSLQGEGMRINYEGWKFPLYENSYAFVLGQRQEALKEKLGEAHPAWKKFSGLISMIEGKKISRGEKKRKGKASIKELFKQVRSENREVERHIEESIRIINGVKGKPDSFTILEELLSRQVFRLCFWKVASEEINYRRFFNVNELICLKTEEEWVFDRSHSLIFSLTDRGKFSGLRVDHIDGLYDPAAYLRRLRKRAGEIFIVVEKILQPEEELPSMWPVQGTTGYDWLNEVNALFCDRRNAEKFDRIYSRFSEHETPYHELVSDKKRMIVGQHMAGDIDNLAQSIKKISSCSRLGKDVTLYGLRRAVVEILAQFPVYRTYITGKLMSEWDRACIRQAAESARKKIPGLLYEIGFVEDLLLNRAARFSPEEKKQKDHFIMRFQQFTGPLMAKGFEDTVLYIYNRLLSLNEVGGSPDRFGNTLEDFHRFSEKRAALWPHSMNGTTSHDTKRGEDVRARLNVLSEIPEEWERRIRLWNGLNRSKKRRVNGIWAPDRNDEYFLYQTLVGAFPFYGRDFSLFLERMKSYVVKSAREAKVHTAWIEPDLAYEKACKAFLEDILEPSRENHFLKEFIPFQKKVASLGIFNSLTQTLLKCTSPGVPDIYQGSELWDLNLVDPDNRRPVDFQKRKKILKEIMSRERTNIRSLAEELLLSKEDGRIKLFLIYRALKAKKAHPGVFQNGTYVPLSVKGKANRHIIAFGRNDGDSWILSVAPRFLIQLIDEKSLPLGEEVWGDTRVILPEEMPCQWKDLVLGRVIGGKKSMLVSEILRHFPVGLLTNTEKS